MYIPKGPCPFMVDTWALQLLYGNPFKAQLSTRKVHGPLNPKP